MKINELARAPRLIEVSLDGDDILEAYGEAITFYTYDSVSMEVYFDFFNARAKSEYDALTKIVKTLVLDQAGNSVLDENKNLPIDILAAAIIKIGEILGNSQSKKSQ